MASLKWHQLRNMKWVQSSLKRSSVCVRRTHCSFTNLSSVIVHLVPISTLMPCSDNPSSFSIQWLMLGTPTSDDVPNFLMLADVVLPISFTKFGVDGKFKNSMIPKVEITQKIRVDGEGNKAQCMP